MNQSIPFFSGQKQSGKLSGKTVLSPLPIRTNISGANYCTVLLKRNSAYLDLGGSAGSIFQGQILYLFFIVMIVMSLGFLLYFSSQVGYVGHIVELINHNGFSSPGYNLSNFLTGTFFICLPWVIIGSVIVLIMYSTAKDMKKVVPFRFHRQRREVAMFKWNKKRKAIVVRYFHWEKVCAMVGEGVTVTPTGMIGNGTLFIGGNDESIKGLFWAAMTYNVGNNLDGALQWETIRRYMDYEMEDSDIVDSSQLTFQSLIEGYCKEQNISVDEFSIETRIWWELNGTRFGIWWNNYLSRVCRDHYKHNAEFEAWSQPIPESEWVKPSDALNYYNDMLMRNEYAQGHNILSIGDIRTKYTKYGEAVENELMS
ncbi:hypothetical protein L4C36_23170 [Photobacterium japonica]|uniref:hypothetical protein n=1 Tax=Photobacterium japonica TaxID=2910235 RepID=UPI003D0FE406